MTFSLIELENKYITESLDLSIARPGLYPTEASVEYTENGRKIVEGKCLREAWYRSMGTYVPSGASAGLMMKAHLGKAAEKMSVNKWKEMGLWAANNIKFFNKKRVISGEMDCVIRSPETNGLVGIEHKSFYGYPANRLLGGSKRPPRRGKPKPDQFLQSIIYAHEYRNILEEYRMYYIERGDGHRYEFLIGTEEKSLDNHQCWYEQIPGPYWNCYIEGRVYFPFSIEDIYMRYDKLINYLRTKTLPPKDYSDRLDDESIKYNYKHRPGRIGKGDYTAWKEKGKPISDWECKYCKYTSQCKQDSLSEKGLEE